MNISSTTFLRFYFKYLHSTRAGFVGETDLLERHFASDPSTPAISLLIESKHLRLVLSFCRVIKLSICWCCLTLLRLGLLLFLLFLH